MNANNRPDLAKLSPRNSSVSEETERRDHELHQAASINGLDISPPKQSSSTAYFIVKAAVRWLITVFLCGAYYLIVRLYEGHTLSPIKKSVFDWIVIGVTLLLGLNIGSAYKDIALHMRPWIDARSGVNIKNIELSSLLEMSKLVWKTRSTKTRLVCALWVFLNLMVQAGIAAVSLTYSADPDPDAIYLAPGNNITIPDLSRFSVNMDRDVADSLGGHQDFAAHMLGNIGSLYNFTNLPEESLVGSPIAKYPSSFWNATDHWEYIFLDSAPSPGPSDFNFLSIYSNRTVKASATCIDPVYSWSSNDSMPDILTIHHDDTGKVVYFPMSARIQETITYLTRPTTPMLGPGEAKTDCGPGCSTVYVTEIVTGEAVPGSYYNYSSGFFYHECNVTVLPTDANDNYTLTSINSAMAAQSIALAGFIDAAFTFESIESEYVQYGFSLPFGQRQYNSAKGTADKLARFAIGTVAAMAQTNPKLTIIGNQPRQGVRLKISSPVGFGMVLGLAALVQLLLLVLAVLLVEHVLKRAEAAGIPGKKFTGLTPLTGQSRFFIRLEPLFKSWRISESKTSSPGSPARKEHQSQPLLSLQPIQQPVGPIERQTNHPDSSGEIDSPGGEHGTLHDHEPAHEREGDLGQQPGLPVQQNHV